MIKSKYKLMVNIKRNANANRNIAAAVKSGVVQNLVKRITGNYVIKLSNITRGGRYAIIGNKGEFLGFAAVTNRPNALVIDLIAARKGFGNRLMSRIINNAKTMGKNIKLTPKYNSELSRHKLINWYMKHGFRQNSNSVGNMVRKF